MPNKPSVSTLARAGWDIARRKLNNPALLPWDDLSYDMREALNQVAAEGWIQGTNEGQAWSRNHVKNDSAT